MAYGPVHSSPHRLASVQARSVTIDLMTLLTREEDRYLSEVAAAVDAAAGDETALDAMLAMRGPLIGDGLYDDPDEESVHDLGALTSEELDYLEAMAAG